VSRCAAASVDDVGLVRCSDKLRSEMIQKTQLGIKIEKFVKSGSLVPDELVREVVLSQLQSCDADRQGFILDGFPRNLSQAQFLDSSYENKIIGVNIMLDRDVTIQKLLGRRLCSRCHGNFNTAHVVNGLFDMPSILPMKEDCAKFNDTNSPGTECKLIRRDDDTPAIIANRLNDFEQNNAALLAHFRDRRLLMDFQVRKGVKDTDQLFREMENFAASCT
jgi:adenylate kinase